MSNSAKYISSSSLGEPKVPVLEVIHEFSRTLSVARDTVGVYDAIVSELAPNLGLEDCIVYEVAHKELIQVAAFGKKLMEGEIFNKLRLNLGEGHAGIAAKELRTIVVDDVLKSPNYIPDVVTPGSEIEVPIILNGVVVAVISSENSQKSFFNENFVKVFEIVATIAAGALARINENSELQEIRLKLEILLAKKSSDISKLLSTLSDQYSELKMQHEKRETLIQEVHHRVNNNLQVISSMLRLHMTLGELPEANLLKSIHNRVQAMALIHQNIYKSLELNTVNVDAYLRDLMNHIRLTFGHLMHFRFDIKSSIPSLSLNTLVPVGLLLVEVFDTLIHSLAQAGRNEVVFEIGLERSNAVYELFICDVSEFQSEIHLQLENEENVSGILRNALLEQVNGTLTSAKDGSQVIISFLDEG